MPIIKVSSAENLELRKNTHPSDLIPQYLKGFSLIELLIVMSIIGLIIAAGTVSWKNAQIKSRDSKRKTDLKQVQEALERFYTVNGQYPALDPYGGDAGNIFCLATSSTIHWGSIFLCNGTTYLDHLPQDPIAKNDNIYYYFSESTTNYQSYTLAANLENSNDPDITPLGCNLEGNQFNYCLTNP